MASVTIPLEGDAKYRDAVGVAATKLGLTRAQMVRRALEAQYGTQIAEALSFFTESVAQTQQYLPESTIHDPN